MSVGLPDEFGDLLTYSRSLDFGQLPDYGAIMRSFNSLAERMGYLSDSDSGPLDWTPCYPEISNPIVDEPEVSIPDKDEGDVDPRRKNSYEGWDLDGWEHPGAERDKDITLPAKLEAQLDGIIPVITEVYTPHWEQGV